MYSASIVLVAATLSWTSLPTDAANQRKNVLFVAIDGQ